MPFKVLRTTVSTLSEARPMMADWVLPVPALPALSRETGWML
jgi:hypothetical protein